MNYSKRITLIELFYYFFLGMLVMLYMLESTAIPNFGESFFHDIVQIAVLISAIFCLMLRKISLKNMVQMVLLNLTGILCYISSGNTGLLMTMLAITLLPDTDIHKILKFVFKEEVTLLILIIILSQIGIIPDQSLVISKGSYIVTGRTLGFSHPNMFAAQVSSIILLYLCTRHNVTKYNLLITSLLTIAIFAISRSRTALLLMFFEILLLAMSKRKMVRDIIYKLLPYWYILIMIMIGACLLLFARLGALNELIQFLNDRMFNGRIGLAYTSLITYPTTLFGKNIDTSIWNEWQYFALDNGQVMIWLQYGILGFIAYFAIIQKILKQVQRQNNYVLWVSTMVLLFWSTYEGTMYFLGKNFIFLLGALTIDNGNFFTRRKRGQHDS